MVPFYRNNISGMLEEYHFDTIGVADIIKFFLASFEVVE